MPNRAGRAQILGRAIAASGAVVVAGLIAAPAASATVDCTYTSAAQLLEVDIVGNDPETAIISVPAGDEIRVQDHEAATIACSGAGGPPDLANTDQIQIVDSSENPGTPAVGDGRSFVILTGVTDFSAGGTTEIDVNADLNAGADELSVSGTAIPDFWRLGALGLNWNAGDGDTDVDVTMTPPAPENLSLVGADGGDTIRAQGALGTSGPFADGSVALTVAGGDGNDVLDGGDGNANGDLLDGGAGSDALRAFAGFDSLRGGAGDDALEGGNGLDFAHYEDPPISPVSLNLSQGTAQSGGHGTDTLATIEGALGSVMDDSLIGDGGANNFFANAGNDTLDGRGGTDDLQGMDGVDTVSYASAPGGVAVDLGTGTASGGSGADFLSGLENVVGSPFADTLTGSALANSITGLGGSDTVSALGGPDSVDVRDGEADTASCGSELDTATADKASVDSVDADCETISFLPEDDVGGGAGGGDDGLADTELSFELTGKGRQKVLKQKGVIVTASCPLEACTATASGAGKLPRPKRRARAKLNLKPVTEALVAGVEERIKLRLKNKHLRALKVALAAGKRPSVTVTADASDVAGNSVADELTVRARR